MRYLFIIGIIILTGFKSQQFNKNDIQISLEYSFSFLDKAGMVCGYDFLYYYEDKTEFEIQQKEQIFSISRKVVKPIASKFELIELIFERDSIEKLIINDIKIELAKNDLKVQAIKIDNLIVQKKIYDFLISKTNNIERIRLEK